MICINCLKSYVSQTLERRFTASETCDDAVSHPAGEMPSDFAGSLRVDTVCGCVSLHEVTNAQTL